jgi:hypothetical protein
VATLEGIGLRALIGVSVDVGDGRLSDAAAVWRLLW